MFEYLLEKSVVANSCKYNWPENKETNIFFLKDLYCFVKLITLSYKDFSFLQFWKYSKTGKHVFGDYKEVKKKRYKIT